jgi:hypothetical protein
MKLMHLFAGQALNLVCSQASTWASESLAEWKLELADARIAKSLDSLDTAENIREEETIAAGKERGVEEARAFEEAWKNARKNP